MNVLPQEFCEGSANETTVVLLRLQGGIAAAWRVASSLNVLLGQINEIAPNRSKASDGSIGDESHCPNGCPGCDSSDHCPDSNNVVRARDFTHDPADGADMGEISEALRLSRDPRIAFVIFNRRIFSSTIDPWRWRAYTGSNPHDRHMHVSVVRTAIAESSVEWEIGTVAITPGEIEQIANASRDATLGRAWPNTGQTLAGTVEALKLWVRDNLMPAAAADETRDIALAATVNAFKTMVEGLLSTLTTTLQALALAEAGRDAETARMVQEVLDKINAGNGNVDVGVILAEIRSQETTTRAMVENLLVQLAELEAIVNQIPEETLAEYREAIAS